MSYQVNSTTISGTVKHARRLNTKSGTIMAWAILDSYKVNMEALFFGPLAEAVLNLDQEAQVQTS